MKSESLENYLNTKKCFKLICGAGNKDLNEIKKLCAVYAAAGCKFFDINASTEAIRAAKEGIKASGIDTDETFICVSVGTKDDPHLSKCQIIRNKCIGCGNCKRACPQKAVIECNGEYKIEKDKCIGCSRCIQSCPTGATEKYFEEISLSEILPPLIKEGIDCIEFHTTSDDEEAVARDFKKITDIWKGPLSVSQNRSEIGDKRLINRLKKMKESCNNLFMIQADGAPMTGGEDDYRTTLQAVAAADIIEKAGITPHIIMSGGTNSKTIKAAQYFGINVSGFAAGSYARKIINKYTAKEDFLNDKPAFSEAVKIAKELIDTVTK